LIRLDHVTKSYRAADVRDAVHAFANDVVPEAAAERLRQLG